MAEGVGEGEHPSPPPEDDGQQSKLPKVTLRTPPKRADIPRLDSVVKLMTHDFSSRQRQRLASNNAFKAITENCGKFGDKPRKLAVCCSRQLCRKEHTELIACVRATRDASMCHEFRDEVERCGAKMSQRMLRAALADDWF